jgi:CRISPR system Cascade subunit CasD
MKTLTIRLSAPLQSYGDEATFARRTSNDYPSKSAVVGMIAAALGYRRDDSRIKRLGELLFAVRVDQPGTKLTEFQTVEWKRDTRKLTYREYLQDAVFVAAVGSDDNQLIDQIADALLHPVFPLYLGRRSNPPAGRLVIRQFENLNPLDVLTELGWQASTWYQRRHKEIKALIVGDAALFNNDQRNFLVKDQPVSFSQRNRQHGYRTTSRRRVALKLAKKIADVDKVATNHDIWKVL